MLKENYFLQELLFQIGLFMKTYLEFPLKIRIEFMNLKQLLLLKFFFITFGLMFCFGYSSEGDAKSCFRSNTDISRVRNLSDSLNRAFCREIIQPSDRLPLKSGRLSRYWAQELIGSDLAKESMLSQTALHEVKVNLIDVKEPVTNFTGQIDSKLREMLSSVSTPEGGTGTHTSMTGNLINGKGPIGVGGPHTVISGIVIPDTMSSYEKAAKEINAANPEIINMSVGTEPYFAAGEDNSNKVVENLNKISNGRILVLSAGNNYPNRSNNQEHINGIFVGSLSPYGWVSGFSSESSKVTILTPSDLHVISAVGANEAEFGGTSGAAPQVTGAISNVKAILGDLSQEEAQILLERTAIRTSYNKSPRLNGAGILNAYKLVEVAKKLKRLGWPANRKRLLESPSTFDFSSESAKYLTNAKKLLSAQDCQQQKNGLAFARKAFLLQPASDSRTLLAEFYRAYGFDLNAALYASDDPRELIKIAKDVLNKSVPSFAGTVYEGNDETGAIRYLRNTLEQGSFKDLSHALKSSSYRVQAYAISEAEKFGANALPVFREAMASENPSLRGYALQRISSLGKLGNTLIKKSLNDSEPSVQAIAISQLSHMGNDGIVFLKEKLKSNSPQNQYHCLTEILKISQQGGSLRALGRDGLRFLEQALKQPENEYNKEYIQKALTQLNKEIK